MTRNCNPLDLLPGECNVGTDCVDHLVPCVIQCQIPSDLHNMRFFIRFTAVSRLIIIRFCALSGQHAECGQSRRFFHILAGPNLVIQQKQENQNGDRRQRADPCRFQDDASDIRRDRLQRDLRALKDLRFPKLHLFFDIRLHDFGVCVRNQFRFFRIAGAHRDIEQVRPLRIADGHRIVRLAHTVFRKHLLLHGFMDLCDLENFLIIHGQYGAELQIRHGDGILRSRNIQLGCGFIYGFYKQLRIAARKPCAKNGCDQNPVDLAKQKIEQRFPVDPAAVPRRIAAQFTLFRIRAALILIAVRRHFIHPEPHFLSVSNNYVRSVRKHCKYRFSSYFMIENISKYNTSKSYNLSMFIVRQSVNPL